MKVVFIGCVEFSKLLLEEILASHTVEVVGIVTKEMSSVNSDFYNLHEVAGTENISKFYFNTKQPASEMTAWIKSKSPDIIFCFGWSHLIPMEVISCAPHGVIGYHPAELPKNRGRHPIIWALVLGLLETASTFFMIDEGADSGDIVSQKIVKIEAVDDAQSLYYKLNELAKVQIKSICNDLLNNNLKRVKQDHSLANYWRKRSAKDGLIDWRMSSIAIHNLIKGLTKPYPGAEFSFNEEKIKIWKAKISLETNDLNFEPGKICKVENGIFTVKTGDGLLDVLEYEGPFTPNYGDYL
jgi:methionyl-tRNA formyltransferase